MCLRVSFKKKCKEIFFCILKVTEERSRIRIRQFYGSGIRCLFEPWIRDPE